MKKLLTIALGLFLVNEAQAQADQLMQLECKSLADEVAKNLKNSENAKKAINSATWISLGEAYLNQAQRCPDDSSSAEKAENAFKKALEVDQAGKGKKVKSIQESLKSPELASAFLMQGAAYYNNKNFVKAGNFFTRSAEINPKDTTAALYAGIAAQMNQNDADAIKYLKRYLDNGGIDPSIYYTISQIYRTQKKYDEAVEILQQGLKANPGNQDLPNEMVNVYLGSNNIDKAMSLLENLIKDDPNNIVNLTNLGIINDQKNQELGRELNKINDQLEDFKTDKLDKKLVAEQNKLEAYDNEINSIEAQIKKSPKTAAVLRKRLDDVKAEKAKIEENIKGFVSEIQAVQEKAKAADGLKNQAKEIEASQNKYKNNAINYYNKVLTLDPNNYEALYSMAVIKFNDAVEIKKVVDYMDIATYRSEGRVLEDKACKQFEESKPYFEKASKIKPEEVSDLLENLNMILEQCKKN